MGADNALRGGVQSLDHHSMIHVELRHHSVNWIFNCPTASQQGGAWERHIRTVRKILTNMENDPQRHAPDDEELLTTSRGG